MAPMKKPVSEKANVRESTVSVAQFARAAGLKQGEVRRLLGAGKMPFLQIRGQIRVPRAELEKLLNHRDQACP